MKSPLYQPIRDMVIATFVGAGDMSTSLLNRACGINYVGYTKVSVLLNEWEKKDLVQFRPTGQGRGKIPAIFNWTGRPLEEALKLTLRHAVEPILADPQIDNSRKSNTRSLLRFLLDLPRQTPERNILAACERIPVRDLHSLPERAGRLAEVSPDHGAQTAANRRSEMKWLLNQAVERDLVPMVFPIAWERDRWTEACHQYFPGRVADPDGDHPISGAERDNARAALLRLRKTLCAVRPDVAERYETPADVPGGIIEEICSFHVQQGQGAVRRALLTAFSLLGKHLALGYRSGEADRGGHLLNPIEPNVKVTGLDGLLRIFQNHEMLPEWEETMRWVWDFETCSPTEHLKREMPDRRRTDPMREGTMDQRAYAVRALLSVARGKFSIDLKTVTVAEVFGTRFKEIAHGLEEDWRARAGVTPQLKQIILSGGLIADNLFRREAGKRGQHVEPTQTEKGKKNRDVRKNTLLKMGREQEAYFAAYNFSSILAKALDAALGEQSSGQTGRNSKKLFPEVWTATGPEYWFRIRDQLFEEIEGMKRGKRDNTVKYHTLILVAAVHCFLLSTGCRVGELAHVRMGVQYLVKDWIGELNRTLAYRAADRKNKKGLDVSLFDYIFPRWLEEEYLNRTRPFFMQRGVAERKLLTSESAARAEYERRLAEIRKKDEVYLEMPDYRVPVEMPGWADHNWFFVDTSGQPYGCPEENGGGGRRNSAKLAGRKNKMVGLWARHTKRIAAALASEGEIKAVAEGFGHHAPHSVRDNVGYAIRLIYGLTAAAAVLGDREATVEDFYSMMSSRNVNTAEFEQRFVPAFGVPRGGSNSSADTSQTPATLNLNRKKPASVATSAAKRDIAGYKDEIDMLKGLLSEDALTPEQYREQVDAAQVQYGIKNAA